MATDSTPAGASSVKAQAQVSAPTNKTELTINLLDTMSREERFVLAAFQGVVARDGRKLSAGAARELITSALTTMEELDRVLKSRK